VAQARCRHRIGHCFGSYLTHPVTDAGELDHGFWVESWLHEGRLAVGWHALLGPLKFDARVERNAHLEPGVVAWRTARSCRGPMVVGASARVGSMAALEPLAEPGQETLFMDAAIPALTAQAT
jgi:hypothetical protein